MKTTFVTVGAAGSSAWIPLDLNRLPFIVSLGATITSGASLTYKVQHTFDDLALQQQCSITRSTTTATLTLTDHGLTAGDSIIVENAGAPFDGTYDIATVTNANVVTYTVANSGATASALGSTVIVLRCFDQSEIVSKTTKADSNYDFPASACRLTITSYSSGKVTLAVTQGG